MSGIGKAKVIALDSNIFIYHFEDNPNFILKTEAIFNKLANKKLQTVTSIISLIETLSYPAPERVLDKIEAEFFNFPNLTVYDVNREIGLEAARIRREYKIKLPDAIQLATAKLAGSKVFITNDQRLKSFKKPKVMLISEIN